MKGNFMTKNSFVVEVAEPYKNITYLIEIKKENSSKIFLITLYQNL